MFKMVKTSYGKIKNLSSPEAAYTAGLIDGDGTIALSRSQSKNRNKKEYRRLEVKISNTDFNLLSYIKNIVGAGQISKKRPRNERQSISYAYRICNRQAFNLLTQISSCLKTYKQKRARLVLENYIELTPRNGKYSQEILARKKRFVKAFFAIPSTMKIKPKIAKYY
ncbi:MAG: LAGLIDADG family homing endonuclease [Candidatus Nealsonbacteria bacterium]